MKAFIYAHTCTVKPVKLNTSLHWTPVYIERLKRRPSFSPAIEKTSLNWTPPYIEQFSVRPSVFNVDRFYCIYIWYGGRQTCFNVGWSQRWQKNVKNCLFVLGEIYSHLSEFLGKTEASDTRFPSWDRRNLEELLADRLLENEKFI